MPTEEEMQQAQAEDAESFKQIGEQMIAEDRRQQSLQKTGKKFFGTLKTSGMPAARKAVRKALRSRRKSSI